MPQFPYAVTPQCHSGVDFLWWCKVVVPHRRSIFHDVDLGECVRGRHVVDPGKTPLSRKMTINIPKSLKIDMFRAPNYSFPVRSGLHLARSCCACMTRITYDNSPFENKVTVLNSEKWVENHVQPRCSPKLR